MKDRIVQFLVSEKISPAEFADKIGVQRSSMSHILNGRNYPSAAFIQKMLQVYPSLNSRWLMIGEGEMNLGKSAAPASTSYPEPIQSRAEEPQLPQQQEFQPHPVETMNPDLFHNSLPASEGDNLSAIPFVEAKKPFVESVNVNPLQTPDGSNNGSKLDQIINQAPTIQDVTIQGKEIEQILFFYKDKTFNVYRPS
ncbi:MAG: helix-turn-helix transcriptional regulator [Bacteroidia bacterium]|nr:helix-turn-helix transcriptional regulator [Bacteroidia bacterium]